MHQKELIHIVDKRFHSLFGNWQGMHQLNADAIHDWRVDFKKLRAVIRLCKKETNKLKLPSTLKEVYKLTGEIRDRQVQEGRIHEWFDNGQAYPQVYIGLLGNEISTTADELHPLTENDALLRIAHHKIKTSLPTRLSRPKIQAFLQQQLYEVRNILWLTYKKDTYLHSCRKHIKDVQYLMEAFGPRLMESIRITGLPATGQLQAAAQELGKFNDECMAIVFLRSSYLNRLPAEEKILLSGIKSKLQKEKTRMRNDLIKSLEQLFKPLL